MIERAQPPDERPADRDRSALDDSVPTGRLAPDALTDDEEPLPMALDADAEAEDVGESGESGEPGATDAADTADATDAAEPAEAAPNGDGSDCPRPLPARIEALLFASGQTLTAARIGRTLGVDIAFVHAALAELVARWKEREGAVELAEVGGGFRFLTRADYHEDVAGLRARSGPEKLSPAALETLAVVAYRQPIARADVEAVRGVQAGPLLRLLQERDLIRIAGRSSEPGHPLLYGTTKRFLDHFGLKSLKALPDLKDVLESA